MVFTADGKYGPEALIDAAGNSLLSATVAVPAGYNAVVDTLGNLTVTGPPSDAVAVTITPFPGATPRTVNVPVMPSVVDLDPSVGGGGTVLSPGTTTGQVLVWDGDSYEPATPTPVTATDIPFTPTGTLAATDVQAAVAELDSELPERVQDILGTALVAGSNMTVTYNDTAGTVTLASTASGGGGGGGAAAVAQGAPVFPQTGYVSGRWYDGLRSGPGTAGLPSGAIVFNPLYTGPTAVTLDRLGIYVSAASASGSARLGIYASGAGGRPGALVLDAGVVSTATIGGKELTISQVLAADTVYWLAVLANQDASGYGSNTGSLPPVGYSALSGDTVMSRIYALQAYGALPANAPALTYSPNHYIVVRGRVA